MRARGDRRVFLGTAAAGVAFAVAAQNGLVTMAGWLFVVIATVALVGSGRLHTMVSKTLVGAAAVLALALVLRTSPWVIGPVGAAIVLLVALGASYANERALRATFPQLGARLGLVVDHLVLAPGMFRANGPEASSVTRARLIAAARGAVLAVPVLLIVGGLLAMADPVFRSWFDPPRIVQNVVLILIGGWLVLGIARAASAESSTLELRDAPRLGTVEVVTVLGSLSALYGVFVAARVVAAFGGADHVESTRGLTYAEYAREGFFQLLFAATITLVVILGVRACADRARLAVVAVSEATIVLTLVVVGVAIFRLELYRDAFGLTPLRLASSVTAVWIGVVFVMLAVAVARRGKPNDWYGPAFLLTGVAFVAAWAVVNPAAVVTKANVDRAAAGRAFDPALIADLGADAVPAAEANLASLDAEDRRELTELLCADRPDPATGIATNISMSRASAALDAICIGDEER